MSMLAHRLHLRDRLGRGRLRGAQLLRASVRENILFGRPYEAQRYAEALKLAALEVDIRQLAEGDQTNVGEAGLRLSSGQRARVAFARAVYSDADALILDDVFAAVDAHTGTLLWETLKLLVLVRGKTVVVATHQMQLLSRPEVSRIALMRDGELSACAAPTEPTERRKTQGKRDHRVGGSFWCYIVQVVQVSRAAVFVHLPQSFLRLVGPS